MRCYSRSKARPRAAPTAVPVWQRAEPGRSARHVPRPHPGHSSELTTAGRRALADGQAREFSPEQYLPHQVARVCHAEVLIGRLGPGVVAFNVQAQPDDVPGRPRLSYHFVVQRPEDAAAAVVGPDVHALDPPEPAVAPVTPFICDHQLADHFTFRLREEIEPPGRIVEPPG